MKLTDDAAAIAEKQPPHPNLAAALVAALADLTVVGAERTAKVEMKQGGNYSYKYADIADVVKTTRPVLARHGLVALTPVHDHGPGLACTVVLLHSSGEREELGPFPFPHGKDAQATGSMVTYHRRYALIAALGMAAGDDDDGAGATARAPEPPAWNQGMAKAHLKNLCKGDTALAAEVWTAFMAGEPWDPSWDAERIDREFAVFMTPSDETEDEA